MKNEPMLARTVRVSIPASVAADLGSLKKTYASVLDKLGCPACCSGFDIHLERQRDLKGATGRGIAIGAGTVDVGVSPAAVSTFAGVESLLEKIADLSGCPNCATGCDIFLQLEEQFVVNPALQVERVNVRARF
jgi:anaerobic selenocysteine-containing dehydrogenase